MNAFRCSECGAVATRSPAEEPFDSAPALSGTRHHRLLNSNEAPLESEFTIVKAVISKERARLARVEQEISRIRDRMKYLEEERASLSGHLAENTAILSPLRRTPPEVLGEIFSWTLPSVGALRREGSSGLNDSPWALTHVSSHWRAVALSIPSLWSLFFVQFPEEPPPLPMAKAQIQRAHSLKLHFYGDQDSDSGPQIELFRCLSEHSARWQELCIGLTSHLVSLLAGLRERLPSLRRLWVQWQGPESQTGIESIDYFQSTPSLVDAAILNEYRFVPTLLPAHQLTKYGIDGPWEMHKAILTVASNLVEARIHTEGPPPDFGEIIHLLRLQRLSVSHEDILGHLSAPVLQEIAFYVPEEEDPDYLLHLDPFLLRSGCSLRRLSFDGAPTTLAAVNILQKYPSITELAIIVHNMEGFYTRTNDLISQLAIPNPTGSAVVSPQLSEITFGCSDESYIDYALYLQMLRSRRNAKDCAITSAVLLTAPGTRLGVATLRGLDVLRRGGMDICVLQGTEAVSLLNSLTYAPSWIH